MEGFTSHQSECLLTDVQRKVSLQMFYFIGTRVFICACELLAEMLLFTHSHHCLGFSVFIATSVGKSGYVKTCTAVFHVMIWFQGKVRRWICLFCVPLLRDGNQLISHI